MRKIIVAFLVMLLAIPSMAFAQSDVSLPVISKPNVTEDKARRIVESWGIQITGTQLSYESGQPVWVVYGIYYVPVGPAKVKMNVLAKLDANTGSFIGLEVKKKDLYDKNLVKQKIESMGITVKEISFSGGSSPVYEVYGYKSMNIDNYWFDAQLYILVSAESGKILKVSTEPIYHTMDVYPMAESSIQPLWSAVVEKATSVIGSSAKSSGNLNEIEIAEDDAVEVQ